MNKTIKVPPRKTPIRGEPKKHWPTWKPSKKEGDK